MPRRGKGKSDYAKGYPVNYKRHGGPQPLPDAPPPPPTSFEESGENLYCMKCGEIFNGPLRGKKMAMMSDEYKAIDWRSDGYCGKRKCVDSQIDDVMGEIRGSNPDKNMDYLDEEMRRHAYESRRIDTDRFPGGLIEEPPAPPTDEGFGDE